jgi:hypothetical protein
VNALGPGIIDWDGVVAHGTNRAASTLSFFLHVGLIRCLDMQRGEGRSRHLTSSSKDIESKRKE